MLDANGQPPQWVNKERVLKRTVDEFIGICKGVLADGEINASEVDFLRDWLERNRRFFVLEMERMMFDSVRKALGKKGDVSDMALLYQTLEAICGGTSSVPLAHGMSTTLPLTKPVPKLIPGMRLCFTGKMEYGSRDVCKLISEDKGFYCHDNVIINLDCLVVGTIASRDWMHTSYGNKISEVLYNNKTKRHKTVIVNEKTWLNAIESISV